MVSSKHDSSASNPMTRCHVGLWSIHDIRPHYAEEHNSEVHEQKLLPVADDVQEVSPHRQAIMLIAFLLFIIAVLSIICIMLAQDKGML